MDLGGALVAFVVLGRLLGNNQVGQALLTAGCVVVGLFIATLLLVPEQRTSATREPWRTPVWSVFRFDWHENAQFVRLVLARFLFLLGIFGVGRFFLFFIGDRLALGADRATTQAGSLLAILTLISVLCSLPAGWAADRFGRGRLDGCWRAAQRKRHAAPDHGEQCPADRALRRPALDWVSGVHQRELGSGG